MATTPDTVIYLLDQLTQLGTRVRTRKMFGEYAMCCDEKVVALICDNQLFLKITPASTLYLGEKSKLGSPYPGAKDHHLIGGEIIENKDAFASLIIATAESLPRPIPKKLKNR